MVREVESVPRIVACIPRDPERKLAIRTACKDKEARLRGGAQLAILQGRLHLEADRFHRLAGLLGFIAFEALFDGPLRKQRQRRAEPRLLKHSCTGANIFLPAVIFV